MHLKWNLTRYLKGNEKSSFRNVNSKRKTRENVCQPLNEREYMLQRNMENAKVLAFINPRPLRQETKSGLRKRRILLGNI